MARVLDGHCSVSGDIYVGSLSDLSREGSDLIHVLIDIIELWIY